VIVQIRDLSVAELEVCTCTVAMFCLYRRYVSGFGSSEKAQFKTVKVKFGRRGVENYTGRSSQILKFMKSKRTE
jgi:hypothetical protein